jgi:hypothetical protein
VIFGGEFIATGKDLDVQLVGGKGTIRITPIECDEHGLVADEVGTSYTVYIPWTAVRVIRKYIQWRQDESKKLPEAPPGEGA